MNLQELERFRQELVKKLDEINQMSHRELEKERKEKLMTYINNKILPKVMKWRDEYFEELKKIVDEEISEENFKKKFRKFKDSFENSLKAFFEILTYQINDIKQKMEKGEDTAMLEALIVANLRNDLGSMYPFYSCLQKFQEKTGLLFVKYEKDEFVNNLAKEINDLINEFDKKLRKLGELYNRVREKLRKEATGLSDDEFNMIAPPLEDIISE